MSFKINFTDFWPGFEKDNFFLKFLQKHFDVVISAQPDYLFCSVYSYNHLKFKDCIKILYTGENLVPDFNLFDYALGFHFIDFNDRYMRFPLYVLYSSNYNKTVWENTFQNFSNKELIERSFCNFVYSNSSNSDPLREKFFRELSKYKKIDSGGKYLNNIGSSVADKLAFIKNYKFTIAFENSSVPGYTTEKLLDPMIMNSIPIYYGNPLVDRDFNIESLILVKNITDFDRAIEKIINLDKDNDAYLEMLRKPWTNNGVTMEHWEEKLLNFFTNIFNQALPVAKRKAIYGFNRYHTDILQLQVALLGRKKKINRFKAKIKRFIGKEL